VKYTKLSVVYEFQPVAVESHGPMDNATVHFLTDLGRKMSECSGKLLDARFLYRWITDTVGWVI